MLVTPLSLPGCMVFEAPIYPDDRGHFCAPFHAPTFRQEVGHDFIVHQTNLCPTVPGAVRGVHFADVPPGQAKYVYAASGALLDVLVDLREGSPTFGQHAEVEITADNHRAVYIPVGVGHMVIGLEPDSTISYLCSEPFTPHREHGICPLDVDLHLPWTEWCQRYPALSPELLILSPKDLSAWSLSYAQEEKLLPQFADCCTYEEQLRSC